MSGAERPRTDPMAALRMAWAIVVAVGVSPFLVVGSARADDDLATCTTRSDRAPSERVIPTGVYADSPDAITIVDGETLCLSARPHERGHAFRVEPADGTQGKPVTIMLRLDPPGMSRALHVRTPPDRWLHSSYAILTADRAVGSPPAENAPVEGPPGPPRPRFVRESVVNVPPGGMDLALPDATAHEFLLDDLWTSVIRGYVAPPAPSLARRTVDTEISVLPGARLFDRCAGSTRYSARAATVRLRKSSRACKCFWAWPSTDGDSGCRGRATGWRPPRVRAPRASTRISSSLARTRDTTSCDGAD
jgi:hypothetical protein